MRNGSPPTDYLFGFAAIFVLPLLYGVLGAIFAAVTAAAYNLVARLSGGVRIELS